MGAAAYNTWDGDAPNSIAAHRPSTDDLGTDVLQDDPIEPPTHGVHPTAAGHNQLVKQVSALAKGAFAAVFYVKFTGGTPAIFQVTGPRGNLAPGLFTVTDLGAGAVRITWAAGTFPAATCAPMGPGVIASSAPAGARWGQCVPITNGIEVRMYEGTSGADLDFTQAIFGS